MEHAGAAASGEDGAGMSTPTSPSALRLLWDGLACIIIGLCLRSLSDQTMQHFMAQILADIRDAAVTDAWQQPVHATPLAQMRAAQRQAHGERE